MALPLFLFGCLGHAPLLAALGAGGAALVPARAPGWRAQAVPGGLHPLARLRADAGEGCDGLLCHPGALAHGRIMAWAAALGMAPMPVTVAAGGQDGIAALCLQPAGMPAGAADPSVPDWSLPGWAAAHGPLAVEAVPELFALAATMTPDALQARLPTLALRVASRLRARVPAGPPQLRRAPGPDDLHIEALERPYTAFFAVEVADLRFRRFDGRLSPPVRRAGFVMADAVTVLPYDPARDRVLVVEQFRYGPLVRGDPNPWSLEAIAGRIDATETPETAARREAQEEAGLTMDRLHPVGRYYPSPGAVSEYIWSYVGLTALPDDAAGIGGLESEAEDIRAHVLDRARLMALIDAGEVENAPLILSALWLQANLSRLRPE